jgi:hypothetical protein
MSELEEAQALNQAELVKEEILSTLGNMEAIKERVADIASKRKTFGKTVDEWNDFLTIKIDAQADPARVKFYLSKLAYNLDIAYKHLTKIKIMYSQYRLSYEPAIACEVSSQANHKGRKVAPSLDTMMKVAQNNLGDRSVTALEYQTFIEFWTDMTWKIKNQVDIVKSISISNGTMLKVGEVFGE